MWWMAVAAAAPVLYNAPDATVGSSAWIAEPSDLMASPDPTSPSLRKLPVGAEVRIVGKSASEPSVVATQVGEVSETFDRTKTWWIAEYSEAADHPVVGYVSGSALVQQMMGGDFNGDGRPESVVVHYADDGTVWVRWWDSAAQPGDGGDRPGGEHSLGRFYDMGGLLQLAEVEVVSTDVAGMPMLKMEVPGSEMCGGYGVTTWITLGSNGFSSDLRVTNGGDAPVFVHQEVEFNPKKRTAVVRRTSGEYLNDGTQDGETTIEHWFYEGAWKMKAPKKKKELPPSPR